MQFENGHIHSAIKFDPPKEGESFAFKVLQALEKHPDRCLLVDAGSERQWSGREILEKSSRIATNLILKINLKPGDVVLSMSEHNDTEIIAVLGAILTGAAICASSPRDGASEIGLTCDLVRPKVILTNHKHQKLVDLLRNRLDHNVVVIYFEEGIATTKSADFSLDQLVSEQPADLKLIRDVIHNSIKPKSHPATFMLTSGSTSRPKLVPTTHWEASNWLASMLSMTENSLSPTSIPPWPLEEDSVFAGDLPLDHGAGFYAMFMSLCLGSKFVVLPSYDIDAFWQGVHDYRITSSIASMTFTYNLMSHLKDKIATGEANKRWDLSCLNFLSCCGAKLAFVNLIREIQQTYPQLNITQCYGCTETGFIASLPVEYSRSHIESVGVLFPGLTAKIVDQVSDSPVSGTNTRGELCILSEGNFKEYRCHPDEDAAQLFANCHDNDGFYKTGDLVHIDDNGLLFIHGRIKDTLFLAEDWKITPAELESIINEHPLVEQSVVIGVPSDKIPGCDAPRAFIKLVKATKTDAGKEYAKMLRERDLEFIAQHVYDFVAARTAEPKHLTGGVRILDEFPCVGLMKKVDRKALRQLY